MSPPQESAAEALAIIGLLFIPTIGKVKINTRMMTNFLLIEITTCP
jgi:hypothetical protein